MQMPIIVPVEESHRECIVVSGKRYCEEMDLTKRDVGVLIVVALIVLTWVIWTCHALAEDRYTQALLVFGVPIILLLLWLFLS